MNDDLTQAVVIAKRAAYRDPSYHPIFEVLLSVALRRAGLRDEPLLKALAEPWAQSDSPWALRQ